MLIRGKTIFVYDIEVFPNLFTLAIGNSESGTKRTYEISDRCNDLPYIAKLFLHKNVYYCGYNNKHYDDAIINFILLNYSDLIRLPVWEICKQLKDLSDEIVTSKDGQFSSWSKYKYANLFSSLDLLAMLFSNKLRVGLKEMQVTMQYHNVQEFDGDFNSYVRNDQIPDILQYNLNDIESTMELLNRCKGDIDLRLAIEDEYGIKALNKDGVNLGMEIIKCRYLQETGLNWADIRDLRSPCDMVCLGDIIFDFIKFKSPNLQAMLDEIKTLCIAPNDRTFERTFVIGSVRHTLSLGGLHSVNKPEIFEPEEDVVLADSDATSLYPTVLIAYNLYPQHLGPEFIKVYKDIRDERVAAKKAKNKLKDATLKLSINGLSGNLQSEFSWCYDPKTVVTLRLNCQLMMIMLLEILVEEGAQICQSNTDGILYMIKRDRLPHLNNKFEEWTNLTKIGLETEYFERFYQYAINDYVGVQEGYSETKDPKLIKKKGLFIDKVVLGKGMAPMIIPEAINKYFVDGIPVDETLYGCKDILKFCTYQKVNKKFQVLYGGEPIRHINRYYMSTIGKELVKKDPHDTTGRKPTALCAGSVVSLYNEFDNEPIENKHINYTYYKKEIYKIINALESKQLSLF